VSETHNEPSSEESAAPAESTGGRFDWNDPNVPAGNGPANFPRWLPIVVGTAWLAWMAFLAVMMNSRT